jgi:hypothetical protein
MSSTTTSATTSNSSVYGSSVYEWTVNRGGAVYITITVTKLVCAVIALLTTSRADALCPSSSIWDYVMTMFVLNALNAGMHLSGMKPNTSLFHAFTVLMRGSVAVIWGYKVIWGEDCSVASSLDHSSLLYRMAQFHMHCGLCTMVYVYVDGMIGKHK